MKKHRSTIILVIIFITGISLLLYPTVSDYWNSFHSTRAIAGYTQALEDLSDDDYDQMLKSARAYNSWVYSAQPGFALTDSQYAEYESQLDITGTGVMSYITIEKIGVELPIYHGTSEGVLAAAVGHIEGSSLPVGGESTHCVLSGHRGLPSARLFTDLDELEVGDTFVLQTLDETLTYEVDQISIVLPSELDELQIVEGQDLCTLVTCTPYGINSHRLLVRGHRIENAAGSTLRVSGEAVQIDPTLIAPIFAAPLLLALLIWMLAKTRSPRRKNKKGKKGNAGAPEKPE